MVVYMLVAICCTSGTIRHQVPARIDALIEDSVCMSQSALLVEW